MDRVLRLCTVYLTQRHFGSILYKHTVGHDPLATTWLATKVFSPHGIRFLGMFPRPISGCIVTRKVLT